MSLKKGLILDMPMKGKLGTDLVTNGTFDTDSDWTGGTGYWTISGGTANCNGNQSSTSSIYQDSGENVVVGKVYNIKFTLSNVTAGGVSLSVGGTVGTGYVTSNGYYEYSLDVTSTTNENIYISANSDFVGSIDNVSIQEVLPNKVGSEMITNGTFDTATTGWTATRSTLAVVSEELQITATDDSGYARQNKTVVSGKTYNYTFDYWNTAGDTAYYQVYDATNAAQIIAATDLPDTQTSSKFSVNFTVPSTCTSILVIVGAKLNTDITYFDNISLREIQTADSTPNANNGTVYGATQNSDSMTFNGTSDYVKINDSSLLPYSNSPRTIATTIKFDSLGTSPRILSYGTWTSNDAFEVIARGGANLDFAVICNSNNYFSIKDDIVVDKLYHLVIVTDGVTNIKFYVDGELDSSQDLVAELTTGDSGLVSIGNGLIGSGDNYFAGDIKDTKIWNRALSASEVALDYKNANPNILTGSLKKGLVLDMPLREIDEKVGSELVANGEITTDITGWSDNAYITPVVRTDSEIDPGTSSVTVGASDKWVIKAIADAASSRSLRISATAAVGKTYRLKVLFYIPTGDPDLYITYGSQNNLQTSDLVSGDVSTKDAWTEVIVEFVSTQSGANIIYFGNLSSGGASGDILYIDGVSLRELQTADLTPNSNHGTVYGATQETNYISFPDAGELQNINLGTQVQIGTGDMTLCVDTYWNGGGDYNTILDTADSIGNDLWFFIHNDDSYDCRINGTTLAFSAPDAPVDEWSHLTLKRVDGKWSLYIEGVYINGNKSGAADINAEGEDWLIGTNQGNYEFNGNMKNFKIYNRGLTDAEIERLYKESLA